MRLKYFVSIVHLCHRNNSTYFHSSETRTGNNLYQELSFQDSEALGDVDEGADITGKFSIFE